MREQEPLVTDVSNCIKSGFGVFMIGMGKYRWTEEYICKYIEKERFIACIVLQPENQDETKRRLQINLPCTTYWTIEADDKDSKSSTPSKHFSTMLYDLYQDMIENEDIQSPEFGEYKECIKKQSHVQAALKKYHEHVFTYAGRHEGMERTAIIATVFEKENIYDNETHSIIEEYNVQLKCDGDTKEKRAVRQFIFENIDIDLSRESKDSIQLVIDKNINYLMRSHINLNAIKASAIRSKANGEHIEKEECIVLYCTGKGNIPLLELPFPMELDGYRTDVREGYFRLGAKYETTLAMGLGIECKESSNQGTIGPFVHELDTSGEKNPYFLTCSHVCIDEQNLSLCPYLQTLATPKPSIYQPHISPDARRYCGEVTHIFFGNVKVNGKEIGVDVASVRMRNKERIPVNARFAEIDNGKTKEANEYVPLPNLGKIQDITSGVGNRIVFKCGSSTGFTWGKFLKNGISFKISHPSGNFGCLANQYEIISLGNKLFQGGDSGAAVYVKDDNNKFCLIGIAIGSDQSGGQYVMTPISAIMKALGPKWEINYFSEEPMQ